MAELENIEIAESEANAETRTTIKIADDVVSVIAAMAAAEVEGVAGMTGTLAGGLVERLGKKNLSKGIKVEVTENSAIVTINLSIIYGYKIQDVCSAIQLAVKNAIETMTGLFVQEVNIFVQGISFPQVESEADEVVKEEPVEEVLAEE